MNKSIRQSVVSPIIAVALLLGGGLAADAQTNSAPPLTTTNSINYGTNTTALQSQGQAVLDQYPVLNLLTNLPTTTFDLAKAEIFIGIESSGSQMNNAIGGHYNFESNFFAAAQITLSGNPGVMNSASVGLGARWATPAFEFYGAAYGVRNFTPGLNAWEFEGVAGAAYKASSAFAVFCQIESYFTSVRAAPTTGLEGGIVIPF